LGRLFPGSVVRNVLHASEASVLVVREAVKAPPRQEG
jgi:nucleotide-binding universal stress UspA family protein